MDSDSFDIVVIGAGPAGSMAAAAAARRGRKVCLVDRLERPGCPVRCGEGIGLKGASVSISLKDEWIRACVSKVVFTSPGGIRVELRNLDKSYILDREKMDYDLALDAQKAGATWLPRTPITGLERDSGGRYVAHAQGQHLRADCLIIADGVESRLARDLGWNTTLALEDVDTCAFARVTHPSIDQTAVCFHVGKTVAPGGYAWVFPRGNGQANVGLGILGSLSGPGKSRWHLDSFIARLFPSATVTDLHCGGVPVGRYLRPLVRDGAMVVGDAARQVGAVNGAGIAYSLWAGKTAGTIAADAFSGETFAAERLRAYEKAWVSSFGKQQLRSYALKRMALTYSDEFMDRIAGALSKENPDRLNYLRVFLRAFAGHPLLLLKAIRLFG